MLGLGVAWVAGAGAWAWLLAAGAVAVGTVVAWGYNTDGQTNVPAGLTGVKAICALAHGTGSTASAVIRCSTIR